MKGLRYFTSSIGPILGQVIVRESLPKTCLYGVESTGKCICLQIKQSGFQPLLGKLCCVFGQDTFLSQCLSPPMFVNGYH